MCMLPYQIQTATAEKIIFQCLCDQIQLQDPVHEGKQW